jgi:hypothetical protein
MTSRDHSIIDDNNKREFRLYQKPFQLPAKLFHEVLVCERIYHSVEREFAILNFRTFALFSESGTTSLLTAKIQFQIVHLLYVR